MHSRFINVVACVSSLYIYIKSLNNIPLGKYATICLAIVLLMDTWQVCCFCFCFLLLASLIFANKPSHWFFYSFLSSSPLHIYLLKTSLTRTSFRTKSPTATFLFHPLLSITMVTSALENCYLLESCSVFRYCFLRQNSQTRQTARARQRQCPVSSQAS